MLLSMTGFGAARRSHSPFTVDIEIKTVNNRYLKFSTRISEGYAALEMKLEAVARESIARGTVNLIVRIRKEASESDYRLDGKMLWRYADQLEAIDPAAPRVALERLLRLPGVIEDMSDSSSRVEAVWPIVEPVLREALLGLQEMRKSEGASMGRDMLANLELLLERLFTIESRAPEVVRHYRERLKERVAQVMQEEKLPLNPADLAREVALFADRSDISEETVRLHSHIAQFRETLAQGDGVGRKLDFLTQEFFREVNTIGSKANDAAITREVVEMKNLIERIREMVQNVE